MAIRGHEPHRITLAQTGVEPQRLDPAAAHQRYAAHRDPSHFRSHLVRVAPLGVCTSGDAVLEEVERSLVAHPHFAPIHRLVGGRHLDLQPARGDRHGRPWISSDTSTTAKATSNNKRESGMPMVTGTMASTIGTAPRRPTQAT